MEINHIIFDWDGTLARTLELWLRGYQCSFRRRGLLFERKEIVADFFHNHHKVPEKHPDLDFQAIAHETRDYVLKAFDQVYCERCVRDFDLGDNAQAAVRGAQVVTRSQVARIDPSAA